MVLMQISSSDRSLLNSRPRNKTIGAMHFDGMRIPFSLLQYVFTWRIVLPCFGATTLLYELSLPSYDVLSYTCYMLSTYLDKEPSFSYKTVLERIIAIFL